MKTPIQTRQAYLARIPYSCASLLCIAFAGLLQVCSGAAELSKAGPATGVSELRTASFNIQGTPLMKRIQELEGILWPEDLEAKPQSGGDHPTLLPAVSSRESLEKANLPGSTPSLETSPVHSSTFFTRPAYATTEGDRLRFLLKLRGTPLNPSGDLFLKSSGLLMIRGTTNDFEHVRVMIQNPPTNAVAYLKSLDPHWVVKSP